MTTTRWAGVRDVTERTDRKLRTVPLARYRYRHEAEFAAAFLADAGIPYRLQMDDPTMAITSVSSATLWVRAMDVEEAREILELPAPPDAR